MTRKITCACGNEEEQPFVDNEAIFKGWRLEEEGAICPQCLLNRRVSSAEAGDLTISTRMVEMPVFEGVG